MVRFWCCGIAMVVLAVAAFVASAVERVLADTDPQRVFTAQGGRVVVDASTRTVSFDGLTLAEARGVIGACVLRDRLVVAQRDGLVLIYDLPDPMTDGPPVLAQRIENVGRDVRDVITAPLVERALVLAAGSNEVFGINLYDENLIVEGEVDEPAFVDHARFFDFLRDGDGQAATPILLALGPQRLALVTESQILEVFHLNRSYQELSRTDWPAGVARIKSIAYTGSRWLLAGLDERAEPVLLQAETTSGPWSDFGIAALDEALAGEDGPIAWLPGGFTITDGEVWLAIRGERAAVASWALSAEVVTEPAITVQWLNEATGR
ncbi:MAG: hypothetical protein ACFCBV_06510 [Phycisphaerales bacterium]